MGELLSENPLKGLISYISFEADLSNTVEEALSMKVQAWKNLTVYSIQEMWTISETSDTFYRQIHICLSYSFGTVEQTCISIEEPDHLRGEKKTGELIKKKSLWIFRPAAGDHSNEYEEGLQAMRLSIPNFCSCSHTLENEVYSRMKHCLAKVATMRLCLWNFHRIIWCWAFFRGGLHGKFNKIKQ
jgi:hypothetical protein